MLMILVVVAMNSEKQGRDIDVLMLEVGHGVVASVESARARARVAVVTQCRET